MEGKITGKTPYNYVKYKIIGVYNGKKEVVDTAETEGEAYSLLKEYRMAYGKDWKLSLLKEIEIRDIGKPKKASKPKKKRPLNEYFKKMLEAKESGASSFTYKGSTYKRKTVTLKSGATQVVYKKSSGWF